MDNTYGGGSVRSGRAAKPAPNIKILNGAMLMTMPWISSAVLAARNPPTIVQATTTTAPMSMAVA